MKTTILKYIFWIFVLVPTVGIGQDYPCYYNTTTNPSAPYNVQIEDGLVPTTYLNLWDWTEWDDANQQMMYVNIDISSDYGDENSTVLNPYNLDNTDYSARFPYNYDDRDFWPEDGWELINKNMGYHFDESPIAPAPVLDPSVAYIMFYNRYTGTIRLFYTAYLHITGNQYSGVELKLMFAAENEISGLYRTAAKYDVALDKTTSISQVSSFSSGGNTSPTQWNMVEFFVGYDPCTCLFRSDLRLEILYKDVIDFNVAVRGISTEVPLDADNDGILDFKDDFLVNVVTENSGTYIFATMDKMLETYIAKLEDIKEKNELIAANNAKVNKWLTIIKAYKFILSTGLTIIPGGNLAADISQWAHNTVIADLTGSAVRIDEEKVNKQAKQILGLGLDQLSSMIKKGTIGPGLQSTLKAPGSPTATISESSMYGTLTGGGNVSLFSFFNPGTYGNVPGLVGGTLGPHYPAYNEVLGMFSMLKTPQLKRFATSVSNVSNGDNSNSISWREQFKLVEPLKIAFNPAIDLDEDNTEISVSIRWKGDATFSDIMLTYFEGLSDDGTVPNWQLPHPVALQELMQNAIIGMKNFELYEGKSIDFGGEIEGVNMTFATPFVPMDVFNDLVGELEFNFDLIAENNYLQWPEVQFGDFLSFINRELFIVVKVDYAFNNPGHNGDEITTTQIYTYQITEDDIVEVNSPMTIPFDLFEYPSVLHFDDLAVGPNTVGQFETFGVPYTIEQNGNTFTIHAFDQIDITGDITVASGYQLQIIAGNSIHVSDDVQLAPEIHLMIGDSWEDIWTTSPTPVIGANEIINYCNNNVSWGGYLANVPTRTEEVVDDSENNANENLEELFLVYPNPARDFVRYKIIGKDVVVTKIEVYDIEGRLVISKPLINPIAYDSIEGKIDISKIDSGLYIIKITTDDKLLVEKFKKEQI